MLSCHSSLLLALVLTASRIGVQAQDRTSVAGEAAITDPTIECTPYSYAPVAAALANFPAIWQPVTSVPANDTAGRAKFLAINGSIPNIAPKGTLAGDFSTVAYTGADPDCWWSYTKCVTPKLSGLQPDVASVDEPRTLGYGFDDGPNCSHNAFYDYLTEKEQKATMFFIGSNVLDWPLEAARAVKDGHEVCVHTWSHRYMTAFTNEGAFGELWYTMQAIKLVTGFTPTCWRPPFGDVDDRVRYIAAQLGLETILWKYDSNDWKVGQNGVTAATVQANYDALIANLTAGAFDAAGAIMLTHELNNYTMQAAIDNYPKLAEAFAHIVPIAVAQNKTQPYVESNYTMQNFAQYTANHSASTTSSNSSSNSTTGAKGQAKGASAGVALRPSLAFSVLLVAVAVAAVGMRL